ncbi:MAG: T9SS type A sorting domain-containing protein [Ignavibacteria bacterium]|nr:T9SS type A sorting domain-containing protein [Ignavibacteria bacterium]
MRQDLQLSRHSFSLSVFTPLFFFTMSLFFIAPQTLFSQSTSWIGGTNTQWSNAANWTNGVPTASVDAVIGDGNFNGPNQPSLVGASVCKSLAIGNSQATTASTILTTGNNALTVSGNITIGSLGTITHSASSASNPISLTGNWSNTGTYTSTQTNATIVFNGSSQTISGTTTFNKVTVNSGTTVIVNNNTTVNRTLTVNGVLDVNTSSIRISGAGTASLQVAGTVYVRGSAFDSTYFSFLTTSTNQGSIVDYAANGNQSIKNTLSYSTLRISGSGTKTLVGDLPDLNSSTSGDGNITVNAGTLDLGIYIADRGSSVVGGTVSVASGAIFRIGGSNSLPANFNTYSFSNTGAVEYYGESQTISAVTYGTLHIIGSGNPTFENDFSVNGLTNFSSGNINDGGFTLTAKGQIINNVTLSGTGKILISGGSSSHSISGTGTFKNVELNDANGASLGDNMKISGTLTFTNGIITTTSAPKVILTSSGSISRTNGHVNGNLQKTFSTGNASSSFEIGDASNYAPVTVSFTNVTSGGELVASTTQGDHQFIGSANIRSERSVNRFWTLTNQNIVFDTYNAVFNFVAGDKDPGVNPDSFIVKKYDGVVWSNLTVGTKTVTSTQVIGATSFSDFQIGHTADNPVPTTTSINPTSKYANESGFTISVTGTNFIPASVVRFNSSDKTTTYLGPTQLSAEILSSDIDTAGTFTVTVFNPAPAGGESNAQTFTVIALSSMAGTLFLDTDGDSIKDVGESGLQNWKIKITGAKIDSMNTDANGYYSFINLQPGGYLVSLEQQNGYVQTLPSNQSGYNLTLAAGQYVTGVDFGNFQYGSISGMKFNDVNGNGTKDSNDVGISGWKIKISGAKTDSTTTDGSGNYSFTNLKAGNYTVSESQQAGWTQTLPANNGSYLVTVTSGTTSSNLNFGNYPGSAKYRTFKATVDMYTKATKVKYKKGVLSVRPNTQTAVENVFKKIGKLGTTFLGVAQPTKDSAKKYAWIYYKKAGDLGKLYSSAHNATTYPIDYLRISGKSDKKLTKALKPDRKTYDNPAWEQGVLFRLNIIASDTNVIVDTNNPGKRFGDLVLDTMFTLFGRNLQNVPLRNIANYFDTVMTYWQSFNILTSTEYTQIGTFTTSILKQLNERFASATFDSTNYKIDSVGVVVSKNPYAVKMMGYKTASEVGLVKELPSVKSNELFVATRGYTETPSEISLEQNYPNPFNPTTTIRFEIPVGAIHELPLQTTLKIYNVLGQEVATLLNNEEIEEGMHEVQFDASGLSSGIYFYKLTADNFSETKKFVLLK